MQQENSTIHPESILFVTKKWNGSDPAQTDYMMQSNQVRICLPPNIDSL